MSCSPGTILEKIGLQGKDCKYPGSGEGVGGKPGAATWPWFVPMDEVLGQRHSTNPPVLIASIPENTPGPSTASTAVVDQEVEDKDQEEERQRGPRSLNWYKKFVAYLFQLCMFNAYVLYRARNPGECKTLLEFIRSVVKSWTVKRHVGGCEEEEEVEEEEVAYNTDPESRLDGGLSRHKLKHLMPTSKKGRPARRYRVCARRGLRSETKM
ncbi:unnamed protein product [Gadus morhua 'NCC']